MRRLQLLAFMILCNTICYNNTIYTYQEPNITINFSINRTHALCMFIITTALSALALSWIFKYRTNNQTIISSSQTTIIGNGEEETKTIDINEITIIDIGGIGNLKIEQSETKPEMLTITADANIMPYLKHALSADIFNKQLSLGCKDNVNISPTIPITFHAVIRNISKISSSGTVATTIDNIKTNELELKMSGTSKLHGSLVVNKLTANLSGTTKAILKGMAKTQTLTISGTAHYDGQQLNNDNTNITTKGTTKAVLNVKDHLTYKVSGTSQLLYYGNPQSKGTRSGVACVKQLT